MRNRQLDALRETGCHDEAAELAAQIAATALHHGDRTEPRRLSHLLDTLVSQATAAESGRIAAASIHATLIRAAAGLAQDPLGDPDPLLGVLQEESSKVAAYRPRLVLMRRGRPARRPS